MGNSWAVDLSGMVSFFNVIRVNNVHCSNSGGICVNRPPGGVAGFVGTSDVIFIGVLWFCIAVWRARTVNANAKECWDTTANFSPGGDVLGNHVAWVLVCAVRVSCCIYFYFPV